MFFIPHFDVFCDLLLNRRTATPNLFISYNKETNHTKFCVSIENELSGCFPHFDKLLKIAIDVIYCLYKMKQTHWLLYESTHSDWFREITQLSNLNRAMSSMRLSLNKTQLRTNQNARRTSLLYKLDRSTAPNIKQFSRAEFQNKTL